MASLQQLLRPLLIINVFFNTRAVYVDVDMRHRSKLGSYLDRNELDINIDDKALLNVRSL